MPPELIFALDCSAYLVSSFSKELTQNGSFLICPASVRFHTSCATRSSRGCQLFSTRACARPRWEMRTSPSHQAAKLLKLVSVALWKHLLFIALPLLHPPSCCTMIAWPSGRFNFPTGLPSPCPFSSWGSSRLLLRRAWSSRNAATPLPPLKYAKALLVPSHSVQYKVQIRSAII